MASLEQIVRALEGRSNGHGMCRCPEHKDRNPSLSATERDGQVLVHCHAGCTQEGVLEALAAGGLDIRQPNGLNGSAAPLAESCKAPAHSTDVRRGLGEANGR